MHGGVVVFAGAVFMIVGEDTTGVVDCDIKLWRGRTGYDFAYLFALHTDVVLGVVNNDGCVERIEVAEKCGFV